MLSLHEVCTNVKIESIGALTVAALSYPDKVFLLHRLLYRFQTCTGPVEYNQEHKCRLHRSPLFSGTYRFVFSRVLRWLLKARIIPHLHFPCIISINFKLLQQLLAPSIWNFHKLLWYLLVFDVLTDNTLGI